MNFLIVFADACRNKPKAIEWLKANKLEVFVHLSKKIYDVLEQQRRDNYDYHKVRFR